MKEGTITKVVKEKKFFFVDKEYWCHFNQYNDDNPQVGDIVEYQPEIRPDGKKDATNVRLIMKSLSSNDNRNSNSENQIEEYFSFMSTGYFNNHECLKDDLIIKFPNILANSFSRNKNINKISQIRKFFDQCKLIESKLKISKDFDKCKSELLQIIPIANNAKEKGHISKEFYRLLEININEAIKSKNNFTKGFIPHFQALIGYYKQN